MKKAAEGGFVGLADDGECCERIAGHCYRAISVSDDPAFFRNGVRNAAVQSSLWDWGF